MLRLALAAPLSAAKQVEPMRVDAAEVAAPQRHAVAIEELQDLDRHLSAVVEPVAKLRGDELAASAPLRRCRR